MAYKLSTILTVTQAASDQAHKHRDAILGPLLKIRECMADMDGVYISYDFFLNTMIVKEMEAGKIAAEKFLVEKAKKLGLEPVGAPDLGFGIHGGVDGPIEFWYQISAK